MKTEENKKIIIVGKAYMLNDGLLRVIPNDTWLLTNSEVRSILVSIFRSDDEPLCTGWIRRSDLYYLTLRYDVEYTQNKVGKYVNRVDVPINIFESDWERFFNGGPLPVGKQNIRYNSDYYILKESEISAKIESETNMVMSSLKTDIGTTLQSKKIGNESLDEEATLAILKYVVEGISEEQRQLREQRARDAAFIEEASRPFIKPLVETADKLISEGMEKDLKGTMSILRRAHLNYKLAQIAARQNAIGSLKTKKQERPRWDDIFMDVAIRMSKRSTCNRLAVGAVLVQDNRTIMQGYNGSLPGHEHCNDVGCLIHEGGCKRTVHAEQNVINFCARKGIPMDGTTLYVTHYPCPDCMKAINSVGIKEVVYGEHYEHRYENPFHEGLNIRQYQAPSKEEDLESLDLEWRSFMPSFQEVFPLGIKK